MAYKLYLDKPEEFICEVSVKNASLKNAFARMVVESNDLTLMFEGKLSDGKCTVPIRKLKGLLDENSSGRMHLEVIVEDTYFKPWEENFIIEQHTEVKVKVEEQKKSLSKPIVEVRTIKDIKPNISVPAQDLLYICEKVGINKNNLSKRKPDFKQVVKEYFITSPEFLKKSKIYIQEAVDALK